MTKKQTRQKDFNRLNVFRFDTLYNTNLIITLYRKKIISLKIIVLMEQS